MDTVRRARDVVESGRVVISTGRHVDGRVPVRSPQVLRSCKSCRRNRPGCSPGTVCVFCQQARPDRQHLADPNARDDLTTSRRETGCSGLARLDFDAYLVMDRSAKRLSRRKLGKRTGLSESTSSYWDTCERHGLNDIRQLMQFADAVQSPGPALFAVIFGQPQTVIDLTAGLAAVPLAGGADHG